MQVTEELKQLVYDWWETGRTEALHDCLIECGLEGLAKHLHESKDCNVSKSNRMCCDVSYVVNVNKTINDTAKRDLFWLDHRMWYDMYYNKS